MSKFIPQNAAVWFEIPVSDLAKSKAFYGAVLQNELEDQDMGPNKTAVFQPADGGGVSGHLYVGKPGMAGSGNTVHLAAPSALEASLERVKTAGGQVVSGIVSIPSGRFAYCLDLDGNSFGLFTS
jgi:predicted enzyme related to lactoylglutathione lyase